MKAIHLGILASALSLTIAHAQPSTTPGTAPSTTMPSTTMPSTAVPGAAMPSTTMPSTTMPGAAMPGARTPSAAMPGAGVVQRNTGTAAASGDRNQAVATTTANAPTPARGRNSFSMGEARRRIETRGFSQVSGLAKDAGGVWRGKGMKDGSEVGVWLDYKGNVGQQ